MHPFTDELRPDRILTHHWRCRDAALDDCGLGLGARRSSRSALASLVAAAGLAAETDQEWVSFSRRRNWYAARAENGDLTYDSVIAGMKEGVEAGLFEEDRALPGAHLDEVPRQSRYRATPLLIERLGNTRFERVRPASSILLRDKDGRPVDYAITDRVGRLRRSQDARNEWTSGLTVTVDPKKDTPENWRRTQHHLLARKVRDGRETWACTLQDPRNGMVRIYSRKRFDCGGRAFGWWQQLPSDRRDELLINGEFTFEPDFPTLHPRFAYAMVGAEMPDDVYMTPQRHDRKHGKLALNVLMNCKGGLKGAVDALMWRNDWDHSREYTQGLVQAIADHNAPIAPLLGSDAGIRFMNLDSGMAMEIMDVCRREDIPCLPVHDSFRVATKSANHVTAIMGEVLDATLARISPSSTTRSAAGLSAGLATWISNSIPQVPRPGAAAPAASPLPASPAPVPALKAPSAKAPAKKSPGKAVSRPVQGSRKAQARPALPTVGEALPADWDLSARTLALVEDYQAAVRARHRKVAAGAAAGWGCAPTASERRQDLSQARGLAQVMAEEEQRTGLCVVAGVPYALSDEAVAKREKRLAREVRKPRPPVRPRRPSTYWAKPSAPPTPVKAKPQGTLF